MSDSQDVPVILESQLIAKTALFDIEVSRVRFPNGVDRRVERIRSRAARSVLIVPLLDSDTLVLVREYCPGPHNYQLAFPTGTMRANETIEQTANRELKEEIGFGARLISRMMTLQVFPGHFDHATYVVLAETLYPQRLPGDEPKAPAILHWPISRIDSLLSTAEFAEARSVAALLLLERLLHSRNTLPTSS